MGHDHTHHLGTDRGSERRLRWALALSGGFFLVELVAGFMTGSLALLSDAGHMATDVAALAIALAAITLGRKPADAQRTYGYRRFEIMAAAVNAGGLFVVAGVIFVEAWKRFWEPSALDTGGMLLVAVLGLVVNLIGMRLLHAGHQENLNLRGAYLEVLADMVGSAAVILAALLIRFTGWQQLDPLVAVAIGLWVLPRAWSLLSESVHILLEGVPKHVPLPALQEALVALPGVRAVHDLHVWAITSGQASLSAHLLVEEYPSDDTLLHQARAVAARHGVHHSIFQIERAHCHPQEADCTFGHADHDHDHAH